MTTSKRGIYTFLACDLISGAVREEVSLTGVTAQRLLDDDGTFSATMPIAQLSPVMRRSVLAATEGGRSTIVVLRDQTPLGEWIIWQRPDRVNDGSPVQLQGKEIASYLKKVIWRTQNYTADDQLQIAWDMVNSVADPVTPWSANGAQIVPAGARGIALAMPTRASQISGVLRQRTYDQSQFSFVGDLLSELSGVEDGFDFDIDILYNSFGALTRVPGFFYPMRGVDSGVVIDQAAPSVPGGNASAFSQSEDGGQISTVSVAIGSAAELADAQPIAASNNSDLAVSFPLLHSIVTYTSVSDVTTLQAHANADATAGRSSQVPPSFNLLADQEPTIGTLRCGDLVHVKVDPSVSYPDGVVEGLRVTGLQYAPPSDGPETYTATVALI